MNTLHSNGNTPPNYDYVIRHALELSGEANPRVLDFGCGSGGLVAKACQRGLDFYGADTYQDIYENALDNIAPAVRSRISAIENNHIDAPDESFDIVVSNQVFEHISHPPVILAEIARILKTGGVFLALFPTRDVWYEGHLKVYFVHWLATWPAIQYNYLRLLRRLGFGHNVGRRSDKEWAEKSQHILKNFVFYHSMSDVKKWWLEAFGEKPRSDALDYMEYRIGISRFSQSTQKMLLFFGKPFLALICRVRAGRVLVVNKSAVASSGRRIS